MRQSHPNQRRGARMPRSGADTPWRNRHHHSIHHLSQQLGQSLVDLLDELGDQLVSGWTQLVEDSAGPSSYLPAERAYDSPSQSARLAQHDLLVDDADDPIAQLLRHGDEHHAPPGFAAAVAWRVAAAGPPPLVVVQTHAENPFATLKEHARLIFGTLSFSAILTFGSTLLLAIAKPSLAFAVLAALVTVGLLLADGARFVWQTTLGAASNPALMLMAMLAPLVVFLVACKQLMRLPRARIAGFS